MSSREAERRGSMPYSALTSLAMEPDMTMATVLLAVATSTAATRPAMPSWAPFLDFTRRWINSMIHWMPPYSFTRAPMQATTMEITVMSYMASMPPKVTVKRSVHRKAPEATPTARLRAVPSIRMTNTFTPMTAPTSTTR